MGISVPTRPRPAATHALAGALGAALLATLAAATTATGATPVAYAAEYKVRLYGMRGGLTIEQSPAPDSALAADGPVWRYRTVIQPKGMARLLTSGPNTEDALFEVLADGRLRPLHVVGEDNFKDRLRDVRFYWTGEDEGDGAAPRAEGTDNEEDFSLPMPPEVMDPALLIPAIALDLGDSDAPIGEALARLDGAPYVPDRGYHFRVFEKGELRDYYAQALREEPMEGPNGETLETLVFQHQREGSTRTTTYWLAPSLDHLPLRIERRKGDKKPYFKATLREYRPVTETAQARASGR